MAFPELRRTFGVVDRSQMQRYSLGTGRLDANGEVENSFIQTGL